jgi:hypothetical protein
MQPAGMKDSRRRVYMQPANLSLKYVFLETDKCNLSHENVLNKDFDFLLS